MRSVANGLSFGIAHLIEDLDQGIDMTRLRAVVCNGARASDMQFNVRRAVTGHEPVLRALRLQALTDSPKAFSSTFERELARTTEDWQRWLAPGVTFILEAGGEPR